MALRLKPSAAGNSPAVSDELVDDAADGVRGNRKAKSRGGLRVAGGSGVYAYQAAAAVQQRTAAVA